MFKVGDKVKCIKPKGCLIMGNAYIVTSESHSNLIYVNSKTAGPFYSNRFVKYEIDLPKSEIDYYRWLASDRS